MLNSAGDRIINTTKARSNANYRSITQQSTDTGNWGQGFESGEFATADWKKLTVTNIT